MADMGTGLRRDDEKTNGRRTSYRRTVSLWLLGALLLAGEGAGLIAQHDRDIHAFIGVFLGQGAVWAVAAAIVLRGTGKSRLLVPILGLAALLRLGALFAPQYLSNDIYRYVWDGRVQMAGINPYRYIPDDPHLKPLRDRAIFPNINRVATAPTIYPPAAEMIFAAAGWLGGGVPAMRLLMVAIEGLGIAALLFVLRAARAPPERILLYAWHPLPVWEIAGAGHVDAAMVMFITLAIAALFTGRRLWSAAALAAATLVKFFPLVLVPAFWRPTRSNRGDWRWLALFTAAIVLFYLPYLGVGRRVFGYLPGYMTEEKLATGSGFWLLGLARSAVWVPLAVYLGLVAAVMTGLSLGALRRAPGPTSSLPWAVALAAATVFFASPHYPWYFVWLVALFCLEPWWPLWWPSVTAVLLYEDVDASHIGFWIGFTIYGGFALLCFVDLARRWSFRGAAVPG